MQPGRRSPRWSLLGRRSGFLYNVVPTTVPDAACVTQPRAHEELDFSLNRSTSGIPKNATESSGKVARTALALYFVSEDGSEWHTAVVHAPYFYVSVVGDYHVDAVIDFLNAKFSSNNVGPALLEHCNRVDLSLPNHIERFDPQTGRPMHGIRNLIKISFNTIDQLEKARSVVQALKRDAEKAQRVPDGGSGSFSGSASGTQFVTDDYTLQQYEAASLSGLGLGSAVTRDSIANDEGGKDAECLSHLGDIYEHDVKYVNRVAIDLSIRCGTWYEVERLPDAVRLTALNKAALPPVNVFAWDIECYKAPLKFPDVETDEIILISIMFNGQGYLIVNRCVVAQDISEFSYQPSEEMAGGGCFKVFNEPNETDLLQRFFTLIVSLAPHIIVTYNGDSFDFPYVQRRAELNGLSMEKSLGVYRSGSDVFTSRVMVNMDCYKWVERDSYLPFGSRTLKQVCKIKLKYNPAELDPEEMVPCARNDPQTLAVYSVSDAVATYFLYMKYIHSFVFALCYIVPLPPNDVLRQGSGTLCENLLMAEAYAHGVLFPNKHKQSGIRYFRDPVTSKHHLIYENSYIGARVETLRCGLFRDDLEERFELSSQKYQELLDDLDMTLKSWADSNLSNDGSTDAGSDGSDSDTAMDDQQVDDPSQTATSGASVDNGSGTADKSGADGGDTEMMSAEDTSQGATPSGANGTSNSQKPNSDLRRPPSWLRRRFARFANFEDVYRDIQERLCRLRDRPTFHTFPRIYHLDVGAMYPNIILSQRLQPTAIVTDEFCQQCSYYNESSVCQKRMQWKQKLEISPVDRSHILPLMKDLESRTYRSTTIQYTPSDRIEGGDSDSSGEESDSPHPTGGRETVRTWHQLGDRERGAELQKVIKAYSQRVFHKMKLNKEVDAESIVCQRENPFYVQTVLKFRDKRYVYKKLKKDAETELKSLLRQPKGNTVRIKEARDCILLNDSLQLAHKCILNSFYGYVKRGGSRWYSMEMGAIVTYAGAEIIDAAQRLIRDIGTPIELDTDGIWCMLPDVFPAVVDLKYKKGSSDSGGAKTVELEYMTTILNRLIESRWTNDQYLEMEDVGRYRRVRRNEILFELDGPWHAMFLPASEKSEDLLKKRYVVFNHQKQIVELKGFEIKRRGEMRMIQMFQEEVFPRYLLGSTKEEAYQSAAAVGLSYRRSLDSRATNLEDDDMFDLLVARKTVKNPVIKQGQQKCFGITTARRLAELFKNESYLHDGNLCMSFLLAAHPTAAPRTARAIPIQTFKVEDSLRAQCLARWLKLQLSTAMNSGVRDILDWDYYREKLDTQLLKLVCIPAVLQGLDNPIPMIQLPGWLKRRREVSDNRQLDIASFFSASKDTKGHVEAAKKRSSEPTASAESASHASNGAVTFKLENVKQPNPAPAPLSWIKALKKQWRSLIQGFHKYRRNLRHDHGYSSYIGLKREMLEAAIAKDKTTDASSADIATAAPKSSIDFSNMYMLLTERWHVYSCRLDPDNPGVMICVVSLQNKPVFATVRVELWRKIYVNCLNEWDVKSNENIKVSIINERYILPRGSLQKNLIELEMRESYFQQHIRNSLSSIFHKTVLGIYEAQLPMSFDFAVKLGNVVNVAESDLSAAVTQSSEFKSCSLQGITSLNASDPRYMEDVDVVFVHVLHGVNPDTRRRNRVFAAVYRKGNDTVNQLFVGGASSQFPRLESEFSGYLQSALGKQRSRYEGRESIHHERYSNPERFPECFGELYDHHLELGATASAGCRGALRKLENYLQTLQPQVLYRKCVLYVYSTVEDSDLGEWVSGEGCPVQWDRDVNADHRQLPSNGFVGKAIEASLELLSKQRSEVELKFAMSRIASLPVGNLLGISVVDANKLVLDVMYARALRASSALLWGTAEAGCDIGLPHAVHMQASEYDIELQENTFRMSSPGVYRGYGAKISFNQTLMYNAIMLESRSVDAPDLAGCDLKKSAPDYGPEELQHDMRMAHTAEFHPLAFRALGGMLDNLIKLTNTVFEKVEYGTFQGLMNICSFINPWLSDPGSIMYDSALYSRAILCTQQYLASLLQHVEHFHQLRAVHVSQSYVVVDTNTLSVTKGRNRVHEAFDNLGSGDSRFRNIPFYLEEEYLAQVQLASDCYIRYKNYVDATHENCTESLKPLEYLPGAVEMFIRYFMKTIALNPLWKTLGEFYEYDVDEAATDVAPREPLALLERDNGELCKTLEKHIVHDWLQPGKFFSRMCDLLENTEEFLSTFDSQGTFGRLEIPNMPGSMVYGSSNWRLEAVKLVAHIMRIDRAIDWNDLAKITAYDEKRHRLFTIAGESEYSAVDWISPMRRIELRSVCCSECFMVFNLDLLSSFSSEEDEDGVVTHFWRCELCGARLSNRDIELRMIKFLQHLFCAYQAQDTLCRECRTVKQLPLSRICQCGGEYVPRLSPERWEHSYAVMVQIADLTEMKCLQEVLGAYRDMW
ncbi:DNA polymerase family B, exonuclease domain containing protein, putative [Babesia bigemina]|uniref:DNA polymerase epsilon catalytic subunit n=1 Tax=Babesia bigemina TaxID=5866 RepID=A0A061DA16_BABBI|nr:DNA polymerase family B, exonuclease domain containing protein, putative [Babesia bigemina]CDR97363.1 DNA polymerase family B, exonuclease domain containing protein, putative [Babesia bigemina]|eukprot:XP_012769549.1 DNA polymerase family B, exonuclease domain containing protein, putative [Babesia bigemina]